jgi:hypothetical protein
VYEAQIHVLAKLDAADPGAGYAAAAFGVAEAGKARALQETMEEGRMDLDAGISPELTGERDRTERLIKTVQNRLRRGDAEPDSTKALDRRLGNLEKTLASLQERIRLENPRLSTLDAGNPCPWTPCGAPFSTGTIRGFWSTRWGTRPRTCGSCPGRTWPCSASLRAMPSRPSPG